MGETRTSAKSERGFYGNVLPLPRRGVSSCSAVVFQCSFEDDKLRHTGAVRRNVCSVGVEGGVVFRDGGRRGAEVGGCERMGGAGFGKRELIVHPGGGASRGAEESGAAPVRARALAAPEETARAELPERVSDAERPRTPREGSRRSLDRVAETLGRLRAEPFLRGTRATCASPSGRGAGDGARRPGSGLLSGRFSRTSAADISSPPPGAKRCVSGPGDGRFRVRLSGGRNPAFGADISSLRPARIKVVPKRHGRD